MKRRDLEEKFFDLMSTGRERIETAPLAAVLIAFVGGIIFAGFWRSLFLLFAIAGCVVAALWFLAEEPAGEDLPESPKQPFADGNGQQRDPERKD